MGPMSRLDVLRATCCQPARAPLTPEEAEDFAQLFKALGDATRVQIVRLLVEQGERLCVCHIEGAFALSQPTISHHLKVLREAGLVTTERRGVWIYYSVDGARLASVARFASIHSKLEV